jgi:predicted ABC-type ATPase
MPYHLAHVTKTSKPRCIVIAGPNGAGKTTFARRYLSNEVGIVHFINADLIAAGLAPLAPSSCGDSIVAGGISSLFIKDLRITGWYMRIRAE